jgi:hypothetical protein
MTPLFFTLRKSLFSLKTNATQFDLAAHVESTGFPSAHAEKELPKYAQCAKAVFSIMIYCFLSIYCTRQPIPHEKILFLLAGHASGLNLGLIEGFKIRY